MKICLIGNNLTNHILACLLTKLDYDIDIYYQKSLEIIKTNRTLAISNDNLKFLKSLSKNFKINSKTSKKIKIFLEKNKIDQLLEFSNNSKKIFNLFKYDDIFLHFLNNSKKNKKIKFLEFKNNYKEILNIKDRYKLIINSETNNLITKKYFHSKISKNYHSTAYTFNIKHKKIDNDTAVQIFTNVGPIAFLPISNHETSVVLSYNRKKILSTYEVREIIRNYNKNYLIKNFTDIKHKNLNFILLRNYHFENILCFGDVIHTIHPLAGQGLNMTIRDIKMLSKILKENTDLGLEINSNVAKIFEKKTKHLNFLFSYGIDFIYEFFNIDNKLNNIISLPVFKRLSKSQIFKKYVNHASDKGLYF